MNKPQVLWFIKMFCNTSLQVKRFLRKIFSKKNRGVLMNEVKCNMLLNDIATGSMKALSELYSEMNRAVFSYALSIVRNRQLAEDITQDVFVKIKFGAEKYISNVNPNGWILKLTKNTSFDALKMQKKPSRQHDQN